MLNRIFFGFLLMCLFGQTYCGYREREEEYVFLERFSQFHCYKHSTCTPGGDQVCGHDSRNAVLAYFNDICLMHLANCKRAGVYSKVELIVCDTKYNYTVKFKDELQFVPILRHTVAPSPVPNTTENFTISDPNIGDSNGQESSSQSFLDDTFVRMKNKKNAKPKLMRLLHRS